MHCFAHAELSCSLVRSFCGVLPTAIGIKADLAMIIKQREVAEGESNQKVGQVSDTHMRRHGMTERNMRRAAPLLRCYGVLCSDAECWH